MKITVEVEREANGRWLTEVPQLPGVMAYGQSEEEAITRVQALALRVLADRLENGEHVPEIAMHFVLGDKDHRIADYRSPKRCD